MPPLRLHFVVAARVCWAGAGGIVGAKHAAGGADVCDCASAARSVGSIGRSGCKCHDAFANVDRSGHDVVANTGHDTDANVERRGDHDAKSERTSHAGAKLQRSSDADANRELSSDAGANFESSACSGDFFQFERSKGSGGIQCERS